MTVEELIHALQELPSDHRISVDLVVNEADDVHDFLDSLDDTDSLMSRQANYFKEELQ